MSLHVLDHPLLQHKLTLLRDKHTGAKEFREAVEEIALLMAYEATRDFPLEEIEIETPITVTRSKVVSGKKVAIVPILRAGLGMVEGKMCIRDRTGTLHRPGDPGTAPGALRRGERAGPGEHLLV